MKKGLFLLSTLMLLPVLTSCFEEAPMLQIEGTLNKTSYNFADPKWDISGVKIYGEFKTGKRELNSNEYTLKLIPSKPRGYSGKNLKIQITYKDNFTARSKSFPVSVTQETYDETAEINEYYSTLGASGKTGTNLLKALQTHSFIKHRNYVKYGEVLSYYGVNDEHRSSDEILGKYKNEYYYTGAEANLGGGSKEHVWACANSNGLYVHNGSGSNYVDNPSYQGAGADLYQVRPCDSIVNTARGNAKFGKVSSYDAREVGDSGPYKLKCSSYELTNAGVVQFSKYVEPADEFKGDIARTLAYVYMHYNAFSGQTFKYRTNLSLSYVISSQGYSSPEALLKDWNRIDPVSEVERYRNHTVQGIQGNRNPFVDHSEWIDSCF